MNPSLPMLRTRWLPWATAYAVILFSRLVLVALPPAGHLYNRDEVTMARSVIDRFLGTPPRTLAWPGSTLQLLTTPAVGAALGRECLHAGRSARSLTCLATGVGHLLVKPWGTVDFMRIVSALLGSLTPLLVAFAVLRLGGERSAQILAGALAAVSGLLWQHESMATGDGISISLALAALVVALPDDRSAGRTFVPGVLVGAALASKVTALGLGLGSVAIVALVPTRTLASRLHGLAKWTVGLVIGLLCLSPWVWTDPVRFLKSTVGNFLRPGHSDGIRQVWGVLHEASGVVAFVFVPLAIVGVIDLLADKPTRWMGAALTAAIALVAVPIYTAGLVYPRYGLPLVAILSVAAGAGVASLIRWSGANRHSLVLAALALPVLGGFVQTVHAEARLRQQTPDQRAFPRLMREMPQGELFLPLTLYWESLPFRSKADLEHVLTRAEAELNDTTETVAFMAGRGLDPAAGAVLIRNFNEDEQTDEAEARAMLFVAPDTPRRLHFYNPNFEAGEKTRNAAIEFTADGAVQAFVASPSPAALLIRREESLPRAQREELGDGWFLYRK